MMIIYDIAGWADHKSMGISVVGAYDFSSSQTRVFCDDNMESFDALIRKAHCAVSFNGIAFDNSVLSHSGILIPEEKCYDLLAEMWVSAGLSRNFFFSTHVGFGLDKTSEVNLSAKKTGNGAYAPVDWQRGRYGTVIDYCLHDVWLTGELLKLIFARGYLLDPRDKTKKLYMRDPRELLYKTHTEKGTYEAR